MRPFAAKWLIMLALPLFCLRGNAAAREAWFGGGNPLCVAAQSQRCVRLATGSLGGFFAAWGDDREHGSPFAQYMTFAGAPLWVQNGAPLCDDPAEQLPPFLVPDGAGGIVAAWADMRNGEESTMNRNENDEHPARVFPAVRNYEDLL